MDQLNLFELMYEKYTIKKRIRMIELFGGIGSQSRAMEMLQEQGKLPMGFEHYRLVEFDKYPVASYNAIHGTNFEPTDITKIHASDLGIVEKDKYEYIMTYSFPCQDISAAGKGKGFTKGSGTRSGLLWEVERLIEEMGDNKVQILLMENVPLVIGEKNINDFRQWVHFLEAKGYSNYYQILNAKDYGIPQNRARCFMVSILGEAYYEFPKHIPLKLKLKDMLEDEVDEKYYLTEKMMNYVLNRTPLGDKGNFAGNIIAKDGEKNAGTVTTTNSDSGSSCRGSDTFIVENMTQEEIDEKIYKKNDKFNREKRFRETLENTNVKGIASTITTVAGQRPTDNFILETEGKKPSFEEMYKKLKESKFVQQAKRIQEDDVCDTLLARDYKDPKCIVEEDKLYIKNATKKGYLEATEGDGIDISSRMENHRGTVQKDMIQTIDTQCNQGVVVKTGNYSPSGHSAASVVDSEGIAPTVMENHGTTTATNVGLRIRKLTPCECWLLMGFTREDFLKASKVNSNAQLYKQAGNSIVVNVLCAIFSQLL